LAGLASFALEAEVSIAATAVLGTAMFLEAAVFSDSSDDYRD